MVRRNADNADNPMWVHNRQQALENLRWATRIEQANNKRAYQRGVVGERIRQIQSKRPDLCYETIRYAIKQGYSNEQIINKPRDTHYASL